jgi:hypothetical protein
VLNEIEHEGLPSTTHRITIRWLDPKREVMRKTNLYLHLIWGGEDHRLVGVKIDGLGDFKHINKALFREYCRELSERLVSGEIDLEYICQRWIAQRFEPEGFCDQLGAHVLSPLDAAAKIMKGRYASL